MMTDMATASGAAGMSSGTITPKEGAPRGPP